MRKIIVTTLGIIYVTFACFMAPGNKTVSSDCTIIDQVSTCDVLDKPMKIPFIPEMIDEKPVKYQMPPQVINMEQELKFESNCMLFCSMEGCKLCKKIKPIAIKLKEEGYDVYILYVGEYPKFIKKMNVTSFPTIIIQEDNKEVKRFVGSITEHQIKKYLKHNEVDYDVF